MSTKTTKLQHQQSVSIEKEGLYKDACIIIEQAQVAAYRSVNETLIKRN